MKPPLPARRAVRLKTLAVPLGLLLLTIAFYWKLTLTRQYTWFDHPDMAYLEIPRLEFQAREIHHGRFPLWDPHLWSGQPLIGQTQPGPLFPLNLIFYLLPLRDGYLNFTYLNWYWAVIHFLAALFAYALARDRGLSQAASVLGGVAFGYGGFVGTVAWLDVVNGALWIPLVFLFVLRSVEGRRALGNAALGGCALGLAWLSGHHELPILTSLAAVFTWGWYCWKQPSRWRAAAVFLVVAGLIGAVQAIPTFEFGRLSVRWIGLENTVGWKDKIPYTVHTIYSLPAKGLLAAVIPVFGRFADASPFLGIVTVAMAALGVAMRWKDPIVRLATAILCGAAVYALGALTPLQGLFYALVPVVDKARIPARAIFLLDFGLALLAAYGLESILQDTLSPATRRLRQILVGVGSLIVCISLALILAEKNVDDRTFLTGVAALAAAAILAGWQQGVISRVATSGGLIALVLIELTNAGPALYSNRFDKNANKFINTLTQYNDIASYLRTQQTAPLRVVVDDQVIGSNFGDWTGVDMLHGYVAGVSENLTFHELHTRRTQELFSVTHYVGTKPDRPEQPEVFTSMSGVKVYRNPNALPRVRAVHEARVVESPPWLRIGIQDPAVDLAKTALFLKQAPELEQCAGEDVVRLVGHSTDRVSIEAALPCRGAVVLSETMFPGWSAEVDGKPTKLWEAYGVFRSVVVDGGRHRIEMRFRPTSVYLGGAMSLLGVILATGIWFSKR